MGDTPLKLDAAPLASAAGDDPWQAAASAAPADWLDDAADAVEAAAGAGPAAAHGAADALAGHADAIEAAINQGLGWFVEQFRPFFQAVRAPIDGTLGGAERLLTGTHMPVMAALLGLLAWQFAGRATALGAVLSLAVVAALGVWEQAMVTLALVLTSLLFCIVIGLPLGIALAASNRAQHLIRPLLAAMQTSPAFVYLVPVVMLFGIGNVPGVIVTIVFALPPLVRLTNLGIRQVRPDVI